MGEKLDISKQLLHKLYYDEGLTQAEMAARLGCCPKTIGNYMETYKMTARTHGDYFQIDLPPDELNDLYINREMSVESLASHFGCSAWTVVRNLRTYGIPVRPARCPARHHVPDKVSNLIIRFDASH